MLCWGFDCGAGASHGVVLLVVLLLKAVGWAEAEQAAPALLLPSASGGEDGFQGPETATAPGREDPQRVLPLPGPSPWFLHVAPLSPSPPLHLCQRCLPWAAAEGLEPPQLGPPHSLLEWGLLSEITASCVLKKIPLSLTGALFHLLRGDLWFLMWAEPSWAVVDQQGAVAGVEEVFGG